MYRLSQKYVTIIFILIFIVIGFVLYQNQKISALDETKKRVERFTKKNLALFQYLGNVQKELTSKLENDGDLTPKNYFDPKLLSSIYRVNDVEQSNEQYKIEKEKFNEYLLTLLIMFFIFIAFFVVIKMLFSKDNKLSESNIKLQSMNDTLEFKVLERTKKLSYLNKKLQTSVSELTKTKRDLIAAEKMANLGELVSSVTHEINSPLGNSITTSSHINHLTEELIALYEKEVMSKDEFEHFLTKVKELSSVLMINLNNTKQLVSSFKNIAVDQAIEDIRVFNVKKYFEEILFALKGITKKTKIKIYFSCDDNVYIKSYPGFFSQILTNFINNSVLHGFDKNDEGEIHIDVFNANKNIRVIYYDTGKGIKEEDRAKIFEQYFTTRKGEGGTGLGLHIIKKIVNEKLDGNIRLNQKDKGVEFLIIVPKNV